MNVVGPVPLVQDLHITHERFGISSDPSINGHLHYPNDLDRALNGVPVDKTRQYHTDYNNRVISFMTVITSTSGRLRGERVLLLFLQEYDQLHYRREAFPSQLKSKVENILTKTEVYRITLNVDGTPVPSTSHTHPSHSQTSRLLTSYLSLGVPVPRAT